MNYRSVVILGQARVVTARNEKLAALAVLVNRFSAGRAEHVRAPNEQELKATTLLALPIAEASAKVRSGGPIDDEADSRTAGLGGGHPASARGATRARRRAPGSG